MLKRFLFPVKPDGTFISVILLIVRVVFGVMLMNHGIDKWYWQPSFSGVGYIRRAGLFNGVHHRLSVQAGYDSHDIYNVCGFFHSPCR